MNAMIPVGIPFGSFARRVVIVFAVMVATMAWSAASSFAQQGASPIRVGENDLGGVVTGPGGPEAGVWVIAETDELRTKFAKMVVTDDQGRYVLPELPKATYSVWVRGYGLVDSPKVTTVPGKMLNLTAVAAPTPSAAAQYYPAIYWLSMLKIPDANLFPGTGPEGNGMPTKFKEQGDWVYHVGSNGCVGCHQLGSIGTRYLSPNLGNFDNSVDAWIRRVQSGQASGTMVRDMGEFDTQRAFNLYADWTDRIAKGELPFAQPERPKGVERNVVITEWDWGFSPKTYLHDEISTDKRHPTVNAYGPLYGSPELSTDYLPVLDPKQNAKYEIKITPDPKTPSSKDDPMFADSPYWGSERMWDSQSSTHNPMFDEKGRVWFTSRVRDEKNPEFCQKGSSQPSAQAFPIEKSNRQLSMYDPKTKKFTLIDTCFQTHHLVFAEDADNTLWTSGGQGVFGYLNTKMFLKTKDAAKSQGWVPLILDTNGNGKRDAYVGPKDKVDPAKDKQIAVNPYGIAVSPVDGSIWGTNRAYPGGVVRMVPGPNPSKTALTEYFEVPWKDPKAKVHGYGPRGMDIDRNGVVWMPLSSGHLASFDRRKCTGPLNGPNATGQQCPEGWTLYPLPGPQFQQVKDSGSAEASYYTWVDQHNTSGLGANTPLATGNENEGLIALVDGKFVILRVPYPLGFYAKGMDGRIDDPKAGWKGRALWTTTGTRAPFHMEGGKGTMPKVIKIQIRANPLEN